MISRNTSGRHTPKFSAQISWRDWPFLTFIIFVWGIGTGAAEEASSVRADTEPPVDIAGYQ